MTGIQTTKRLYIMSIITIEWNTTLGNMDSFINGKQVVLLKEQVFRSQKEHNFFYFPKPPIDATPHCVLAALRVFSSGVNWPQRKADHPHFAKYWLWELDTKICSPCAESNWEQIYFYPKFYCDQHKREESLC
jgi:hypothetical protein